MTIGHCMRATRWAALGLALGCSDAGKVTVNFDWRPGERPEGKRVALCARVQEIGDSPTPPDAEFSRMILEPGESRRPFRPPSLEYGHRYRFSARASILPDDAPDDPPEKLGCADPVDYYGEVELEPDTGVHLVAPTVPLCFGPGTRRDDQRGFDAVGRDGVLLEHRSA